MRDKQQGDRLLRGYLSSRRLLLVVGIITPVGILVVNASAFVMRNLEQVRIGIAVCALTTANRFDHGHWAARLRTSFRSRSVPQ